MQTHRVHAYQAQPRGVALIGAVLIIIVLLGLAGAMSMESWSENNHVSRTEAETKGLFGAESGIALGERFLWNDYITSQGGAPGLLPTYTAYLQGANLADTQEIAVPGIGANLAVNGDAGTLVNRVTLARRDALDGQSTILTLTSVGQDRFQQQRTIQERIRITGGAGGLEFAILAKDMSCIFCHAQVDNVGRVMNVDPAKYGTFDRIKVASLRSTMLRPNQTDTDIAGTLYVRGDFLDKDRNMAPMTPLDFQNSTLDAFDFDPVTGYIQQNAGTGAPRPENLQNAVPDGNGVLPAGENLYLDYPTNAAEQTDGYVPDEIPPVFADTNANRLVDANEIQDRLTGAQGDIGYRRPGSISGGVIYTVPHGSTYNSGALPAVGNTATIDTVNNGVYSGNVILTGTEANPLVIDKTVIVDGDLIIQGVVSGMGQIYVSGNVYVTGDIEYPSTHSWDAMDNGLVIKSGGNTLINDFLTPSYLISTSQHGTGSAEATAAADDPTKMDVGDHRANGGAAEGYISFTTTQMAIFNRAEWQKTQQFLPDSQGRPIANSTYDPTYVPKYYVMGPGDPVYVFANRYEYRRNRFAGTYWDNTLQTWLGDELDLTYNISEDKNYNGVLDAGEDIDGNGRLDLGTTLMLEQADVLNAGGAVFQYTPTSRNAAGIVDTTGTLVGATPWISDQNLKQLWISDHNTRADGKALTVNAGIETDSTIFLQARDKKRYGRKYKGHSVVNGMLVANNVGMLSPGDTAWGALIGIQVNYDARLQGFDGGNGLTAPVKFEILAREYVP